MNIFERRYQELSREPNSDQLLVEALKCRSEIYQKLIEIGKTQEEALSLAEGLQSFTGGDTDSRSYINKRFRRIGELTSASRK